MIALALVLALGAAPGCPAALAEVAGLDDAALAPAALGVLARLDRAGAGGPSLALGRAARTLSDANDVVTETHDAAVLAGPARAFRATLARHCEVAALPADAFASAGDRAALAGIMARPEFRRARIDPLALRRLLLDAWAWVLERLGTEQAERWAGLGRALFLGAAAAAAGLATLGWVRRRRRRGEAGPATATTVTAGPGPDRALERAEAALGRGEHAGAVREAMLAALGALERAGRIPRGRALTNAELVRAVGARDGALAGLLGRLARTFDGAVYGGLTPGHAEASDAVDGARRLDAAVRG